MNIGLLTTIRNVKINFNRAITHQNIWAFSLLGLFIVANTFKIAIFDSLIINPGASLWQNLHYLGIWNKFCITGLLFVVLSRFARPALFIAFYCLQIVYMFANVSYHSYFEGYVHIHQYLGLFTEALDLVKHSAIPLDGFFWFIGIDVPFFIVLIFNYRNVFYFNKSFAFKKTLLLLGIWLIVFAYKWDVFSNKESLLGLMNNAYAGNGYVVSQRGLFAFNLMDLLNYKDNRSHIKRLECGPEIAVAETDSLHPNIVMLQVESMDSYIVNFKHKGTYVTPYLHALTKQSIYFPYMLSFHKAGSTSDCEFSIINSVEPFDDYPAIKIRNYEYPNSLLKQLGSVGYSLAAFHGNRGTYFNRNIAFKQMGFTVFYDIVSMGLTEQIWGASDGDVFRYVRGCFKKQKEPFFYYIITMSSHEPFNFVAPYYSTNVFNAIHDDASRNYCTAMSYVDGQIKDFVSAIQKNFPNTYIYIYGDHTPIINKSYYKRATFMLDSKLFEFVPLFILTPDKKCSIENKQIASFLDLSPTLLHASKIGFKIKSSGTNLLVDRNPKETIVFSGEQYSRADLFKRIKR